MKHLIEIVPFIMIEKKSVLASLSDTIDGISLTVKDSIKAVLSPVTQCVQVSDGFIECASMGVTIEEPSDPRPQITTA